MKTQDHCDRDMFSNLALAAWLAAKKDEANVPVSTCSMPASSSSTVDAPTAPALEWIKMYMFP